MAAAAIVARLAGWPVNPSPMLTNTCDSYLDDTSVVHVSSVHAYDAAQKTFLPVPGAGGLSPAPSREEAVFAWNWAHNIWADCVA